MRPGARRRLQVLLPVEPNSSSGAAHVAAASARWLPPAARGVGIHVVLFPYVGTVLVAIVVVSPALFAVHFATVLTVAPRISPVVTLAVTLALALAVTVTLTVMLVVGLAVVYAVVVAVALAFATVTFLPRSRAACSAGAPGVCRLPMLARMLPYRAQHVQVLTTGCDPHSRRTPRIVLADTVVVVPSASAAVGRPPRGALTGGPSFPSSPVHPLLRSKAFLAGRHG
mmetsp:Transcript_22777/g.63613  ORF Transcript_22777/g.63613 Transcript_22777/m.63613 type:complete len:227 (-) Transcript_22777:435-1115(-)